MSQIVNIGICDDEVHMHDEVSKILIKYEEKAKYKIQDTHYFSAKELLDAKEKIHILLLDIEMPNMDGIEAASKLVQTGRACKIIMLTSSRDRFKDAFKIGAYRFVTKPIDFSEIKEALDDAINSLIGYKLIEVKINNCLCRIFQYQIDYIQASGDYMKVYIGNTVAISPQTMKWWIEQLDARLFVECHKSYIINLQRICNIQNKEIVLDTGENIPVSRRKKEAVIQAYMEFDSHH